MGKLQIQDGARSYIVDPKMADNILFSVLINIPIKSIDIRAVARALIGGGVYSYI